MLSIGFNEYNDHHVYPLFLDNLQIGDITINKYPNQNIFVIFGINLYDEYQGKGYFPQFLNILEEKAKQEKFKFIVLQWVTPNKIQSLKNRGYKEISLEEKKKLKIINKADEIDLIKEINP